MADRGRLNEVLARPSPAVLDTSVGAHADDRSPTGREFNGALKLAENNLEDAECDEAPPPYFLGWSDEEEEGDGVPHGLGFGASTDRAWEQIVADLDGDVDAVFSEVDGESGQGGHTTEPATFTSYLFGYTPLASDDAPRPSATANMAALRAPFRHPFTTPEQLYGYLLLRGQRDAGDKLYEIVRDMHNHHVPHAPLPCLSTMRGTYAARVREGWSLPFSSFSAPTRRGSTVDLLAVLPSTHLSRDMALKETYDLFKEYDECAAADLELEPEFVDTPFFRRRWSALCGDSTVGHFSLSGVVYSPGDTVNVSLRAGGGLRGYKVGDCRFASTSAGVADGDGVHAGDFLASLSCEGEYRGDLLLRHWGVGDYPTVNFVATGARAVPVSRVCHEPGAVVGWTNTIHPPPFKLECIGADKIPVLVVCLAFYSDDFNVRRQRKASLGGVYMSYMSWLHRRRTTRHATRTIGVVPPDVDSDNVLRHIQADLTVGIQEGWVVSDPDGNPIRVKVDVSFYVGGYPHVSRSCKLKGHGGDAPCTLCSYVLPGAGGSQYAKAGSSADISLVLTTDRSAAVLDAVRDALVALDI